MTRRSIGCALVASSLGVVLLAGGPVACGRGSAPVPTRQAGDLVQPIAEAALPAPVLAAVRQHPHAKLVRASHVVRGTKSWYDLTLTGTRKTRMIVEADGHVVSFE